MKLFNFKNLVLLSFLLSSFSPASALPNFRESRNRKIEEFCPKDGNVLIVNGNETYYVNHLECRLYVYGMYKGIFMTNCGLVHNLPLTECDEHYIEEMSK